MRSSECCACSLPAWYFPALQALESRWCLGFLFFFQGYFYPFVLPSLGLRVRVTGTVCLWVQAEAGGLGGDFDSNKAQGTGPLWSSPSHCACRGQSQLKNRMRNIFSSGSRRGLGLARPSPVLSSATGSCPRAPCRRGACGDRGRAGPQAGWLCLAVLAALLRVPALLGFELFLHGAARAASCTLPRIGGFQAAMSLRWFHFKK